MSSLPIIIGGIDVVGGLFAKVGSERASWQWQPITVGTSATHDPSPPITIDTNVPAPAGRHIFLPLLGVG